jgi:hypothetical protein
MRVGFLKQESQAFRVALYVLALSAVGSALQDLTMGLN